jgi:hypothetical protein
MVRLSTPTTTPAESRRLIIRLESRSTIPRFEQLRAQISVMVAVGRLEPRQLGLNPSETVQAINAAITRNQTGDQTG